MKEIIESLYRLTKSYELLIEKTDQVFNALKIKDYDTKAILEFETEELYKEKEKNEHYLIHMVKAKAEQLGLEDKRIEAILDIHDNEIENMKVQYGLEKMLEKMKSFQLNLRRNIEFAAVFIETKGKEIEIMFEVIRRESIEQGGPLLINEEL